MRGLAALCSSLFLLRSLPRRLLGSLANRLASRLASRRLTSGCLPLRGLASGRLALGGLASGRLALGGLASRCLLLRFGFHLRLLFHYPLSHWTSLFLYLSLSLSDVRITRTKKMMRKFEHFVDSKMHFICCKRVNSSEPVA